MQGYLEHIGGSQGFVLNLCGKNLKKANRDIQNFTDDDLLEVLIFWAIVTGRDPNRVVLGDARRKLITRALREHNKRTIYMACIGCKHTGFNNGQNSVGKVWTDIELILRNEANIERFAARGEEVVASMNNSRGGNRTSFSAEAISRRSAMIRECMLAARSNLSGNKT